MSKGVDFLKKLGGYILTVARVAGKIDPELQIFTQFLPVPIRDKIIAVDTKVQSELTLIANSIVSAEVMAQTLSDKNITGLDKAKSAAVTITQVLLNAEFMAGREVADAVLAQQIAEKIAGDFADWLKNVKPNHVPDNPNPGQLIPR